MFVLCCRKKKDYFSDIPGEVLSYILTFLPITDLISASEISKKFNHASKSFPCVSLTSLSVLQQDPHVPSLSEKLYQPGFLEKHAQQFVWKTNELVKHHYGRGIESFEVHFSLNSEHASSIDADAREIVLNFTECLPAPSGRIYKFPYWY